MTRREILFQLPSVQGWALYSWSVLHNEVAEVQLAEPGYIAQAAFPPGGAGIPAGKLPTPKSALRT
ncbi:MAG TPA: hypothetical protein PKI20_05900 [Verrucomicrobiota bacterium]|nr:hypothetical protein [Verrucomicrobiota bacterium]HQL77167.1 hypothetical protein [Verrucomicrobiota bacterium]